MTPAPLFDDLAMGPAFGRAWWLETSDGKRIRIGIWGEGDKGTILLFPGRTEYIEKYGPAAEEFRRRGFATLVIDWRGQGLADRMLPDRAAGYVHSFSDFQKDVQAVIHALPRLDLSEPFYLIGHSMGGCIGLRAAMQDLPIAAACFSGPMWGIHLSALMRPTAWAIAYTGRQLGLGAHYAPGSTRAKPYPEHAPFEGNDLTTDREMYDFMRQQTVEQPDLGLGGPTLHWAHEALIEVRALRREPSPGIPALTFLGSDECIVSQEAIRERMARWPGGQLEIVEGGRHEVMMECPSRRKRFYDTTAKFFESARAPILGAAG